MVNRIFFVLNLFVVLAGGILTAGCGPRDPTPTAPPAKPVANSNEVTSGPGVATSADGVEIAYTVRGQGEPALVFVHGWLCDQSFWSEQVDVFAADHTVVTLDLAGHGQSGSERSQWPLASFGADVQAVVEGLGLGTVILIGHSLGGPVALEAAQLMEDRVVGVIGVDTFQNAEQQMDPRQLEGFLKAYENDFVGTCRQFVESMNADGTDTALVEHTVSEMCDARPEIAIAQLRAFGTYEQSTAMARTLAPVRGVNAARFPTNVEGNRKFAPTFEVSLMDGVGHFLMIERPEEFNKLLAEWITDLENRLVSI